MKNKLLSFFKTGLLLLASIVSPHNLSAQTVPTILTQPVDQSVRYGSNAIFSAVADGTELKFQWQKDGMDLADYENIAGSQTPSLEIISAGQKDAANYSLVISNGSGAITSSIVTLTVSPTVVFEDDFESGSLANWSALSTNGDLTLSNQRNHTSGGSKSAEVSGSLQKMYHNLGIELSGRTRATFWIRDGGTNGQSRALGEIRGYTGKGHMAYVKKGGMNQMFAIGRYDAGFGTNNTGSFSNEVINVTKYQGRVLRGTNAGWFNLDAPGAPDRSPGWHKFEIERLADGSTVRFKVDGVVGKTITGAHHVFLDSVTIGSIGSGTGLGNAWFDDVMVEAFLKESDWETKDSNGKGLFDWMKLREIGTNAEISDITRRVTVSDIGGSTTGQRLGEWVNDGVGIYAKDMRGYAEYAVNAPVDDAYRIEVEGRERNHKKPLVELPLVVSIDGEYLGRFILPYGEQTNGYVHCFTPFVLAGTHTIRIYWDNAEAHCSLYLQAVRLQSLLGPDSNANGMKDWVESRLLNQSGIENTNTSSAVSPACIEGRGQYLTLMELLVGTNKPETSLPIQPGAGRRWYCDVPLSPNQTTKIAISYQNGGLNEALEIAWQITNLLEADDIAIRKGDSLLLTAVPTGQTNGIVRIQIQGVTNYITDAATPIAHRFDRAGVFTVAGRFNPTGVTRSIKVKVVEASFDAPIATWINKRRYVTFTNFLPVVALDADPRIQSVRVPTETALGTNARGFSITNDSTEDRMLLARLGAKGPVIASTPIKGFRLFNSVDTYLRLLETYPDGSELIEAAFIMSPTLPEVTVDLKIIVSGVTFDDGTVSKQLSAADYDDLGIYRVRFVRAAGVTTSVCHVTKAYQDGILIGWPSYPE